jgi:hypothetical protein
MKHPYMYKVYGIVQRELICFLLTCAMLATIHLPVKLRRTYQRRNKDNANE